jgi:hypothetical protein
MCVVLRTFMKMNELSSEIAKSYRESGFVVEPMTRRLTVNTKDAVPETIRAQADKLDEMERHTASLESKANTGISQKRKRKRRSAYPATVTPSSDVTEGLATPEDILSAAKRSTEARIKAKQEAVTQTRVAKGKLVSTNGLSLTHPKCNVLDVLQQYDDNKMSVKRIEDRRKKVKQDVCATSKKAGHEGEANISDENKENQVPNNDNSEAAMDVDAFLSGYSLDMCPADLLIAEVKVCT